MVTLATKIFKVLAAIITAINLDIWQSNAINVFINN